jgi:hypothetical protein
MRIPRKDISSFVEVRQKGIASSPTGPRNDIPIDPHHIREGSAHLVSELFDSLVSQLEKLLLE